MLRPNAASVFQSHSSQFAQHQQASATVSESSSGRVSPAQPSSSMQSTSRNPSYSSPLTATSYLSTSPSYPTISLPDAVPPRHSSRAQTSATAEVDGARTSLARMQLHQMQDEARRLGLNEKSAGWLILEALQAATEGEWAAIAELLASGEATLLLPRDPPSVFTSASQLSASFAYDHCIFNASSASAATPLPSVVPASASSQESLPILTLSGLRGSLSAAARIESMAKDQGTQTETFELTLQSFVVKTSQSPISNLKDAAARQEVLETLAPLPNVTSPEDADCWYPSFTLTASNAQFPLPPPLNARTTAAGSQAGITNRGRSNSMLNAAGSRASASFASIFGGSGRERKRQAEAAGTADLEMVDAQKLSANAVSTEAGSAPGVDAPVEGSQTEVGAQPSSSLGVDMRADAQVTSNEGAAVAEESTTDTAGRRTVSVWVVDHLVRRSAVMRTVRKTLDARIKKRLSLNDIPEPISVVVASFAATYLPPVPSLSNAQSSRSADADRSHNSNANQSRAPSPSTVVNPPYLADSDEMSETFQDFFNSIRDQLYKLDSTEVNLAQEHDAAAELADASSATARLDSQRDQHDRVEQQLGAVESVLCEEVYDRIFCPATSRDRFHDDALASRIAALNVLGLSLRHLGLDVPSQRSQGDDKEAIESNLLLDGLDRIVQQCGTELQRLESGFCRSPQAKLEVLVRAHKIAVKGVADLPSIKMRDDDDAAETKEEAAPSPASKKTGDSTSADLILPILIYSIVCSNPSHLASNLLYIQRFRAESLVQGETSYCLVNVQAAVAFLENVDVKDLGLDSSQIGAHLRSHNETGSQTPRSSTVQPLDRSPQMTGASSATLAMPSRIRGRLTQEIGDLAGASNKVITGVMGSSISAFSRMMGANANAAEANGEGPTQRKRSKSSASLQPQQESVLASPATVASRPTAARTRMSSSVAATDYSSVDEQARDVAGTPTADKPSIGDRLAMLGRLGASALSSSPSSSSLGLGLPSSAAAETGLTAPLSPQAPTSPRGVSRELPGPPPPTKNRTASYLASQLGRITAPRSTSSASLSTAVGEDAVVKKPDKPLPTSLKSPYPPLSRPPTAERPLHVVLASTGSVASVKIPLIVEELLTYDNVRVQIIATDNSLHFYDRRRIEELNLAAGGGSNYDVSSLADENRLAPSSLPAPRVKLWTNADEWSSFRSIGDPILHIELRRWADVLLIAPCSANTLAKIWGGLCDDLLTSFVRALERGKRKVLFPAMNTAMWENEVTEEQVQGVRGRGWEVSGPVEKRLACGDVGRGAMCEWTEVVGWAVREGGLVRRESGVGKKEGVGDAEEGETEEGAGVNKVVVKGDELLMDGEGSRDTA
ncbi:hypothetical protein PHSY_006432 [Pseudozyma hubeiensis SY62]|uniref:VPS9 domain-containing protein n=1 Tax=Pseudozyma hubeiensis (strain SY62) TaxID=1305764 RepID=R9PCA3_PSEHS|nr:hypothetical protein PHSY_006432 [Pseudozyma hubeiensis SY62]GAC98837.1 hypothetical protein PHSY_006432 [Pseudozyma hubeiensis SY62]